MKLLRSEKRSKLKKADILYNKLMFLEKIQNEDLKTEMIERGFLEDRPLKDIRGDK